MRAAGASAERWNLSTQSGASTATTAALDWSPAILSAVLERIQPPQLKPMIMVATAPTATPWRRRKGESPFSTAGNCMRSPFASNALRNEVADGRIDARRRLVVKRRPQRCAGYAKPAHARSDRDSPSRLTARRRPRLYCIAHSRCVSDHHREKIGSASYDVWSMQRHARASDG